METSENDPLEIGKLPPRDRDGGKWAFCTFRVVTNDYNITGKYAKNDPLRQYLTSKSGKIYNQSLGTVKSVQQVQGKSGRCS